MSFAARIFVLLSLMSAPALAAPLTVVELYQSQGCSSCPPAIANVNMLADRPDILALTFAVTYWDQLGWKDTFAKPAYTARQYDYAHGLHHANVYTPQTVIDGRADQTGTDRAALLAAIAKPAQKQPVTLSLSQDAVAIGASSAFHGTADIWLVRYDPRSLNVAIGAGENSGVTIAHRNVVRDLAHLGTWSGEARRYAIPAGGDPAWRAAILVQAKGGGPILAAAKL
jgi:hypothetical protein